MNITLLLSLLTGLSMGVVILWAVAQSTCCDCILCRRSSKAFMSAGCAFITSVLGYELYYLQMIKSNPGFDIFQNVPAIFDPVHCIFGSLIWIFVPFVLFYLLFPLFVPRKEIGS